MKNTTNAVFTHVLLIVNFVQAVLTKIAHYENHCQNDVHSVKYELRCSD